MRIERYYLTALFRKPMLLTSFYLWLISLSATGGDLGGFKYLGEIRNKTVWRQFCSLLGPGLVSGMAGKTYESTDNLTGNISLKPRKLEDRIVLDHRFESMPDHTFSAIMDGHGGTHVADFLEKVAGNTILANLDEVTEDDEDNIKYGCLRLSGAFCKMKKILPQKALKSKPGSTLSFIIHNRKTGNIKAANIGDSPIFFLYGDAKILRSRDHNIETPEEVARLKLWRVKRGRKTDSGVVEDNTGCYFEVEPGFWSQVTRDFSVSKTKDPRFTPEPFTYNATGFSPVCAIICSDGLADAYKIRFDEFYKQHGAEETERAMIQEFVELLVLHKAGRNINDPQDCKKPVEDCELKEKQLTDDDMVFIANHLSKRHHDDTTIMIQGFKPVKK